MLNAVVTLEHRDADAADDMLIRLAELLRLPLRTDAAHETMLAEELAVPDLFLTIMHARFADQLVVCHEVPAALFGARVPAFVLHPRVENALEHGAARLDGAGRVELSAPRDGCALVLTVRDDGPGVGPAGAGVGLS